MRGAESPRRDDAGIGGTLVSGRDFDEYAAMFALTHDDLRGRVLDCPAGAADFVAQAAERGVDAVAADPVYGVDRADMLAYLLAETRRGHAFAVSPANTDRFTWSWFGGPEAHLSRRLGAVERFAADRARRPERYVAAALPDLPFPDNSFDLALSSHFLFTYADRLDEDFHHAALVELARVAAEVRVFPLVCHADGHPGVAIDALCSRLALVGIDARRVEVAYAFERGATHMLGLRRRKASTARI